MPVVEGKSIPNPHDLRAALLALENLSHSSLSTPLRASSPELHSWDSAVLLVFPAALAEGCWWLSRLLVTQITVPCYWI